MAEKPSDSSPGGEPRQSEPYKPRPCPICGKPSVFEARPFCSKRCADVDLHRWLGGHYAIPVVEAPDGDHLDEASEDE